MKHRKSIHIWAFRIRIIGTCFYFTSLDWFSFWCHFSFQFSFFISRHDLTADRFSFFIPFSLHFYLIFTNEIANTKNECFVSFHSFYLSFIRLFLLFDGILKADKWQFYLPVFFYTRYSVSFRICSLIFVIAPSGRLNRSSGFDAALFCFTISPRVLLNLYIQYTSSYDFVVFVSFIIVFRLNPFSFHTHTNIQTNKHWILLHSRTDE